MTSKGGPTSTGAGRATTPPAPTPSGSARGPAPITSSSSTRPGVRSEAEVTRQVSALLSGNASESPQGGVRPAAGGEEPGDGTGGRPEQTGLLGDSDRFSVDPAGETEDDEGRGSAPAEGRGEPLDVKAIARAMGLTPKQVYEGLQFDVGGDAPLSLGQLKDAVKDQQTASREAAERETRLHERETSLIRDQQLLARVTDDLKGKLAPETVRALQLKAEEHDRRERNLMLRTMPEETSSPQALHAFGDQVAELLGAYGFGPHELVITDHRMLLVLRDMLRWKRLLKDAAAIESRPKEPPKAPGRASKPPRPDRGVLAQRARQGSEADKVAAVASLIRTQDNGSR